MKYSVPVASVYIDHMHVVATVLSHICCDMQDGTVNVHTIREGQYLRTLHPIGCVDPQAEVAFLTLSHLGHIAFSASEKVNNIYVYVQKIN